MRRRAHGIFLVRTDALELVQGVVAELRRREEEASLQDTQRVCEGHGVEVLDLHLRHQIFIVGQCHLVEITVLTLDEEEEEVLELVRGVRHNQQSLLLSHLEPSGNGTDHVGMTLLLVHKAVFAAHENAAGSVHTTWDGDQGMRTVVDSVRELSGDVVQSQVHFVQSEHLLGWVGMRIAVHFLVTQLDCREQGVLKAHVHTDHGVDERVALERLQWG
mmetsp:Transcript_24361/g.64049  ORF Transcript_24361/g.64049 Transcript_24361/m.64049 type:complete len:217 (+) Transcript_24361:2577-3227(+)